MKHPATYDVMKQRVITTIALLFVAITWVAAQTAEPTEFVSTSVPAWAKQYLTKDECAALEAFCKRFGQVDFKALYAARNDKAGKAQLIKDVKELLTRFPDSVDFSQHTTPLPIATIEALPKTSRQLYCQEDTCDLYSAVHNPDTKIKLRIVYAQSPSGDMEILKRELLTTGVVEAKLNVGHEDELLPKVYKGTIYGFVDGYIIYTDKDGKRWQETTTFLYHLTPFDHKGR